MCAVDMSDELDTYAVCTEDVNVIIHICVQIIYMTNFYSVINKVCSYKSVKR